MAGLLVGLTLLVTLGQCADGWSAMASTVRAATDAQGDPIWIGPPGPWTVDQLAVSVDGRVIVARRTAPIRAPEELVRTTDGGATWERIAFPSGYADAPNRHMARLRMALAEHGGERVLLFSTGDHGRHQIVRSTDLGTTWTVAADLNTTEFEQPALVLSPAFEQDGVALLVTERQLYRTADAGRSWTSVAQPADRQLRSAAFSPRFAEDRRAILLLGPLRPYPNDPPVTPPMALTSVDGGLTWTPMLADPTPLDVERPVLAGLWFAPAEAGPATLLALVGAQSNRNDSAGRWLRSRDGGASWQQQGSVPIPMGWQRYHLAFSPRFVGDGVAVLGGDLGCDMVRTADGGTTWTAIAVSIPGASRCNGVRNLTHDGAALLAGFEAETARGGFDSRWTRSADSGATWAPLAPEGTQPWIVQPLPAGGALLGSTAGVWAIGAAAAGAARVDPFIACAEPTDGPIGAIWRAQPDARRGLGCPLDPARPAWIREQRDEANGVTSYWIDGVDGDWYQLGDAGRWRSKRKAEDPWPGRAEDAVEGLSQAFEGGPALLLLRPDGGAEIVVLTQVDGRWRRYPALQPRDGA